MERVAFIVDATGGFIQATSDLLRRIDIFHGAPTDRSHRATLGRDCPELLRRVREDRADAAILVAV